MESKLRYIQKILRQVAATNEAYTDVAEAVSMADEIIYELKRNGKNEKETTHTTTNAASN